MSRLKQLMEKHIKESIDNDQNNIKSIFYKNLSGLALLNLVHKNGTIYFELVKKYYYDSSDGMLYQNKDVLVVGGGNSAMEDVAYLTKVAKKTYLIKENEKKTRKV